MQPEHERLRQRRDFDAVYRTRRSWASSLLALHLRLADKNSPGMVTRRFGFVVSKKVARGAHDRNRIKRRLREICRLEGFRWRHGFDVVLVARAAAPGAGYADLRAAVCHLMHRAGLDALPVEESLPAGSAVIEQGS